jgi:NitT/TauT family transport system permease protein
MKEPSENTADLERSLSLIERLWNQAWLRKALVVLLIAVSWEIYARVLNNELMVPTFLNTIVSLASHIVDGELLERIWNSLGTLCTGYVIGVALAVLLSTFAATTRIGNDILETLTAMLNPLPAIALLPLSLLWFGIGSFSIVFVIVHSVLWPITVSTHGGFSSVSPTLRMVGRNYGLHGPGLVGKILIPAALPGIITGLKNGWAFAWRTLIAAELVFGVSSGSGGLGWFIFEKKNQLDIDAVFAGLLSVILIGVLVENLLFRLLERATIFRWGMQEV